MERTGGLILCGGRSSRMGQDKGALRLPSGTTLERALENMGQVAHPLVVSLAAGAELPPLPGGVLAVRDEARERGPLWGLLAGFRALAGQAERVLVMPVDMPFYTPVWMNLLLAGLDGCNACLFRWQGFTNALTAAYRLDLLPKLETLVAEGRARPLFLSEGEPAQVITAEEHWREGEGPPPLMDMDTPEDYRAALLFEGVGNPNGVPVTVEFALPGAGGGKRELPLCAATPHEVVVALSRLWPEVPGGGQDGVLLRLSGGGWAVAAGPLVAGERLRFQTQPGDT